MSELMPAPEPYTLSNALMLEKVAEIYQAMLAGQTQTEACAAAQVEPRTFRNWMQREEVQQLLADSVRGVQAELVSQIMAVMPQLIARQIYIAADPTTHARDATNAFKGLVAQLEKLQVVLTPPPPAPVPLLAPIAPPPPPPPPTQQLPEPVEEADLPPTPAAFRPTFLMPPGSSMEMQVRPAVIHVIDVPFRSDPEPSVPSPDLSQSPTTNEPGFLQPHQESRNQRTDQE